MMTNEQLYLAIGIPMLFNAALVGALIAYINAKFDGTHERFRSVDQQFKSVDQQFKSVDQQFRGVDRRFDTMEHRFDAINQRFDDMRDLWRAELHRVEEILDARLKHLEER